MRVKLSKSDLGLLFDRLFRLGLSNTYIASELKVPPRTFSDWKSGKSSLPDYAYDYLIKISDIPAKELAPEIVKDYWHVREAGRLGAREYRRLYGNPATEEGRRKGGLNSLNAHIRLQTKFQQPHTINRPRPSQLLAEMVGIIVGDGHLSEYQVTVTTNALTDLDHALFIKKVLEELFQVRASIAKREKDNTVTITVSSKRVVEYLKDLGIPQGNKIANGVTVPQWVSQRALWQKGFIRGLFDTDGCIYLDKHSRGARSYKYLGWAITSHAPDLLLGVKTLLVGLGFSPSYAASQNSIFLRRGTEVERFFEDIGTHNPKHLVRYQTYVKGRVPKWS